VHSCSVSADRGPNQCAPERVDSTSVWSCTRDRHLAEQTFTGAGFADPKTFYRYAFQFLIGDLLTVAWQADLVIDENSTPEFQAQLESYLRRQNSGLPVNRLGTIKFSDSSKQRLIQLADLVAGGVRRASDGEPVPLREIEHKMINLQFWPPR
jgi:hypothetical protein